MVHLCKMISPGLFSKILIFWVVGEVNGQKNSPKWQEIVFRTPYFRNHASYDRHLWYTSIKWYFQAYFSFFKSFDFSGCLGASKNGPKWQKIVSHSVSQKAYIIRLSFLAHIWKMMTSPDAFFHFFKMLIFWVVRVPKGQKMTNLYLCISRTVDHIIKIIK